MKLKVALLASTVALAFANGTAAAQSMPRFAGNLLVDANGMTLYTFDKDATGKSTCSGGCATAWPPAAVAADEKDLGEFTLVTREDGSRQWAHKRRPLYRFAGDAKAGDANGDNQGNTWHIVRTGAAAQAPQVRATGGMSYGY